MNFIKSIENVHEKAYGLIYVSKQIINSEPEIAEQLLWQALDHCIDQGIDYESNYWSIAYNLYKIRDVSTDILVSLKKIGGKIFDCFPVIIKSLSKYHNDDKTAELLWNALIEADKYISHNIFCPPWSLDYLPEFFSLLSDIHNKQIILKD